MALLAKARSFLRNLISTETGEADLEQDLQSHLVMLIEENIRSGMQEKEAQPGRADRTWRDRTGEGTSSRGTDWQLPPLGDLRLSLWCSTTPQKLYVHRCHGDDAGSRNRCQHRSVQYSGFSANSAISLSQGRTPRESRRVRSRIWGLLR